MNYKEALNYVSIIVLLSIITSVPVLSNESSSNSSMVPKSRTRRYLIFQPGTRILFRINTKDNVIKNNQIFAHAFGFRANIDLLQPIRPEPHRLRRREVYDTLEELINQQGFDGRACILKTFCDASQEISPRSGMLFKIFKLIFTQQKLSDSVKSTSNDKSAFSYLKSNNCEDLQNHCPLSLLELTPYTDV